MTASDETSGQPRVLLLSALVGAGHAQAAKALLEALRCGARPVHVEHADVLQMAPRWFRAYYAGGFSLLVTKLSWLYGLGFWASNRPHRAGYSLTERLRLWNERRTMKRLVRFLEEYRPDLIVNTHFLAPPIIARLVRSGHLRTRQVVAVTDYQVHRWWYSQGVDHWFLPADVSLGTLARWGVPPDRITVSGIPVHPKWTVPHDRARVLADWNLPADRPIVILTGGTEFTCGPIVKIARGILDACRDVHLVVLAGRNKDLLGQLSHLPEAGKRLCPVPFTDRSQELVEVCSLIVTKPGGMTTSECLAKGAPMVLLRPVPGQEKGNALYFQSEGAAVITRSGDDVVAQVRRLLEDRSALARMAASARRLYRPATQTIVEAILKSL
jgi:processive 1,2-diacylglycerol beta-glucosyltransferase